MIERPINFERPRRLRCGSCRHEWRVTPEWLDRFNQAVGLATLAQFPDLDAIRRSRLKKANLFEMDDVPELDAVRAEYLRLAAALWAGTDPLSAVPLKDRDIFDLLGFQ